MATLCRGSLENGERNTENQPVPNVATYRESGPRLATNLSGFVFRVVTVATGEWWHYDGLGTKNVTVMHQPTDVYVRFRFEEVTPGLYKIQSVANDEYMFDGGDSLNGLQNPDDDYQRFWVYHESDTTYRIVTKATGSYVRVKEDQYVSSEQNIKDDYSLFTLTTV